MSYLHACALEHAADAGAEIVCGVDVVDPVHARPVAIAAIRHDTRIVGPKAALPSAFRSTAGMVRRAGPSGAGAAPDG